MILGIDEVGRGPWAGPLVVGAVVLGGATIEGLTDSKKLSKKRRDALDIEIRDKPLATDPRPPPAKPIAHDDATTPEKPLANTSGNTPATPEPAIDAEDKHKQLIIRNLGTPVILEFGYERQ